jgi:hypothetical protein
MNCNTAVEFYTSPAEVRSLARVCILTCVRYNAPKLHDAP